MFDEIVSLINNERYLPTNLSNTCAYLYNNLDNINWLGFYLVHDNMLWLGPFQGKPACIKIEFGKGVCGTAYSTKKVQRVANVHKFPTHICCDPESKSEIVIPIIINNNVVAVLDVDSPIYNRFSYDDELFLVRICKFLESNCDWNYI